jgi:predicted GNAT family N-acyltransferase
MSRLHGFQRAEPVSPAPASGLSIRVLKTVAERSAIAELRQYAPMDAERDLDAGAADLEELKDSLGVVVAVYRDDEAIATIRAIPSGHGVTLAEKSWCDVTQAKEEFGARSWEVGRLIVAPEHRSAELLRQCIVLALRELIRASDAEYLHASCSPLMARLYRRFGFATEKIVQGEHGLQHALVHARVSDVARALRPSSIKVENTATRDHDLCPRHGSDTQPQFVRRAA